MKPKFLEASKIGLLIIDFQEKLFPVVDRGEDILNIILKLVKAFQILDLPIFISEQYPEGLGSTVSPLKTLLGSSYLPHKKTAFSCLEDPSIAETIIESSLTQWILVGLEAHICVLQTAKSLLQINHEVIIPNDAITSRSIYDFSTAIAEMRDDGARITSYETILFELLGDAKHPDFQLVRKLVEDRCGV